MDNPMVGSYLVLISDCEQMVVSGQPFKTLEEARDFAEGQDGVDWIVVKVEAEQE